MGAQPVTDMLTRSSDHCSALNVPFLHFSVLAIGRIAMTSNLPGAFSVFSNCRPARARNSTCRVS